MKGICGLIRLDGAPIDAADIASMRRALVGRGASIESAWSDASSAFIGVTWSPGSTPRDESTVHVDDARRTVVVADALLTKRDALFDALSMRRAARDEVSDAALVSHAYARWGAECVTHLYGDFAFVVWDRDARRVLAARDSFGARPLHVHHAPGRLFAFASNASAVVAARSVPRTLNEARIGDFLLPPLEGIDHTSTFFASVSRLSPAHVLSVRSNGCVERRYYAPGDVGHAPEPTSFDDAARAVREGLEAAVQRHVATDMRVGSMLSGGLDSSALAAIASTLAVRQGSALPTFSAIDSTNDDCEETRAIRTMLDGTRFDPHLVDRSSFVNAWPDLAEGVWPTEEPFDSRMLLVDLQYRMASREGVGGVLDGIDADTLFCEGGYMGRLLRNGRLATALSEARGLHRFHGWSVSAQLRQAARDGLVPPVARRLYRVATDGALFRTKSEVSIVDREFAHRVDLPGRLNRLVASLPFGASDASFPEARAAISHTYISGGLDRYRRVAAHHGVEPRHPFLDRDLVELCVRFPDEYRLRSGVPKAVLRRAVEGDLHPSVAYRRGKAHLGWSFSRTWLSMVGSRVVERLGDERHLLAGYVDDGALDRILSSFRREGTDATADPALLLDAAHLAAWLSRFGAGPKE